MSRSANLYKTLMDKTVLSNFFQPALNALGKVRHGFGSYAALPMDAYILVSCLRHLQGQKSLREQIQQWFHLADKEQTPIARSSYSDALNSKSRADVVKKVVSELVVQAGSILPDRLKKIEGIGSRSIYAVDGSYQKESAHFQRQTPKEGGTDNHKGHMMLTFFDVRMGIPIGVRIETTNRHELLVLKEELMAEDRCFKKIKNAIFVVDRAFVDMPFWDEKNRRLNINVITRSKVNLTIEKSAPRAIATTRINDGIMLDENVKLKASKELWRRITYSAPNGSEYVFLTNDFTLEPGVVAFLYLRRWDEEKCFDTWKNDFSSGKAWAKSIYGIYQQAAFAIATTILAAIFSNHFKSEFGIEDEKCFAKQDLLNEHLAKNLGQRTPWYSSVYRATAKISRQVLRFLKMCFLHKSSSEYYVRQLKPLFLKYL